MTFQNELFMMRQDGDTKEKITDTCFVIINDTEEKDKKYHLKCQSTPDRSMVTPGGEVVYPVPVMKVQKYTIEEIIENKLLFLIPFYIFSYEKIFDQLEKNEEQLENLKKEFLFIQRQLEEMCMSGEITEYVKCTLLDMTKKVVENIAKKHEAIREGVKQVESRGTGSVTHMCELGYYHRALQPRKSIFHEPRNLSLWFFHICA